MRRDDTLKQVIYISIFFLFGKRRLSVVCMFYFHNNLLYSHKAVPSWLPLVPVQASSAFTARENALLRGKVFIKKLMLYLMCFFSNFLNQYSKWSWCWLNVASSLLSFHQEIRWFYKRFGLCTRRTYAIVCIECIPNNTLEVLYTINDSLIKNQPDIGKLHLSLPHPQV